MSMIHIHVGGSFADDARRILAAAPRAEPGNPAPPEVHISFEDWGTFFRVLTPTRVALLRHIHAHHVPSIRGRAQRSRSFPSARPGAHTSLLSSEARSGGTRHASLPVSALMSLLRKATAEIWGTKAAASAKYRASFP
jgi:hypothetical protein